MNPQRTTLQLEYESDGNNVTGAEMTNPRNGFAGASGIDAGGRIVFGVGTTTAGVIVRDSVGRELHNATVTASKTIPPVPTGIVGPLLVSIDTADGPLTVYWSVRK